MSNIPLSVPELEERMRPGAMSHGGFLGPTESLEAVLAKDRHTLEEAQVTYDQVADALERVLQSALDQRQQSSTQEIENRHVELPDLCRSWPVPRFSLDHLPDPEKGYWVDGTLQVFFTFYRGFQLCPWCGDSTWGYFDFLILSRRSGEYITGPGMIVHLIREHQFFEGSESPYRVEPLKAIRVLELGSGLPETAQPPARLPNDQFQATEVPSHSSGASLTVSHWPARLIGVVGVIIFALFSALAIAANSPCGMIVFIPFTLACIPLAFLYGQTSINHWGITHSSPLGRYTLDWDEMNAVVMDIGDNTIVFKGQGKQFVLPGFAFWAGRDKQAVRGLMDQELKRRGIKISKGFAAFAISRGCRVKGPFGLGKGTSVHRGNLEFDPAREAALRPYLDRMAKVMDEGLGESAADNPKRDLARRWTATALRQLDSEGTGLLLRFLYESGLIGGAGTDPNEGIVSLKGVYLGAADLSEANLQGADLRGADLTTADLEGADLGEANLQGTCLLLALLSKANLRGADLRGADLHHAFLEEADLREADLRGAFLDEASLNGANLSGARLAGANLSKAELRSADLKGAQVTAEQLAQAKTLKGATMPDGRVHK
jgi:hypothetical protein